MALSGCNKSLALFNDFLSTEVTTVVARFVVIRVCSWVFVVVFTLGITANVGKTQKKSTRIVREKMELVIKPHQQRYRVL